MIPRRLFALLDFAALYLSFVAAYVAYPRARDLFGGLIRLPLHKPVPNGALPNVSELLWLFIVFALAMLLFLGLLDSYRPVLTQSLSRIMGSCAIASFAAIGIVAAVLFALRRLDVSRFFIFSFAFLGTIALIAIRLAFRSYFKLRLGAGFYAKNVVLIGPLGVIEWLCKYFHEQVSTTEYRVLGYLSLAPNETGRPFDASRIDAARLGRVGELGELLIHKPIHEVVAVEPASGGDWLPQVISDCDAMGVLLRIVPEGLLFGKTRVLRTLYPFQLLHLPAVVLAPPHLDSDALFVKRVLDIVISAVLLVLLSPLFIAIALLIKIADPRSAVFYRWKVVGRNGARFIGYKFTTMYSDADERRKDLLEQNEMTGPVFKIKRDPRVTPVGRFLRKFSLNELPQLWSVLKGDMSLVGPRPAFPHELEGYGFWHKRKLSIRPGMTCLWQVRGRNKISNFDDWVKMDLEYIDNWSLWLDFKILARTAWAVVAGTGS